METLIWKVRMTFMLSQSRLLVNFRPKGDFKILPCSIIASKS